MKTWIQNRQQLEISPERKLVLDIAEAGLAAIDPNVVMKNSITLEGSTLTIKDKQFTLSKFKRILVIGFGKASTAAAESLEQILGDAITDGVVISVKTADLKHIRTFAGTHPLPSLQNVDIAKKMAEMIHNISETDLVICLVSGGGSALLCWDELELAQNTQLYNDFLKTAADITVLDTVRKHISSVKGGGLAQKLYPATVIGLIFSDIAGDNYHLVASGPTYKDESTSKDAQTILDKFNLTGYELNDKPADEKYFEKVFNFPIVSNVEALQAMKKAAEAAGIKTEIVSAELLDGPGQVFKKMRDAIKQGTLLLGGSEISLSVPENAGKGGRNTYLCNYALPFLTEDDTFASVASDGKDNADCAGAIVDQTTSNSLQSQKIDGADYLQRFDSYSLFEKTGHELIITGPTGTNVSDYLLLYRK